MTKEQNVYVDQYNDIPNMKIQIRRTVIDHITEDIALEVQGLTLEECKDGINFLISSLNTIPKEKTK